jgi:PadR family transcriptional regulator PadR
MKSNELSSDLLRGHTDTMILGLLAGGDQYGYGITKLVLERSGGLYELKEATMYSSLKRLEKEGYITSYWGDETQGGRRRYYHITRRGHELYRSNKEQWEYAKRVLDRLL